MYFAPVLCASVADKDADADNAQAHYYARAHDSVDDSMRYDNSSTTIRQERDKARQVLDYKYDDEGDVNTGVFRDEVMIPFSEEELKEKLAVDFMRTPRSDEIVFQNPRYQGRTRINNKKYGYNYYACIWKVELLRLNDATYDTPKPALIQIRERNLRLWTMDHPEPECLFPRRTRLIADEKGRIISIDEP